MYTAWFKFTRLPFRLRPDPEFLYLPPAVANQYSQLLQTARQASGAWCVTGDNGTGKTTVLNAAAKQLGAGARVVELRQPTLVPQEMLTALGEQFGLAAGPNSDPVPEIKRYLAQERGMGRQVAILVDDAHLLPSDSLRLLMKIAAHHPAPFVLFAGNPALPRRWRGSDWNETRAELKGVLRLARFELPDTTAYIQHRLALCGCERPLFDDETLGEIQRYTGGTPPLINRLCDASLTLAAERNNEPVAHADVRDAVRELQWVEYSARTGEHQAEDADPAEPDPADERAPPEAGAVTELLVEQDGKAVNVLRLRPGKLVVGRGDQTDLRLDSQFISRQHCQIVTTDTHSYIEDLGSTNGILVNGKRRRVHRLAHGDRIGVGDFTLSFAERDATTGTQNGGVAVAEGRD